MHYKLFFSFLIINILSFSLPTTYASASLEEESHTSSKHNKRVKFSSEADKENQRNLNTQKKQCLSKREDNTSTHHAKRSTLSKLIKKVDSLTNEIKEAYVNASKMDLYESYNAFKALKYNEQTWAELGQQMNIERWPAQESWKETVGGQLFFPASRIHQYQESSYTEHLLQRADILHGCIFAATFRHSLGLFYTTHILWTINRLDDDIQADMEHNRPNFYTKTMKQAYQELSLHLDRPDVCYALGNEFFGSSSLTRSYVSMKGIDYYKKGDDLKNQCAVLIRKMLVRRPEFKVEDFLSLARQGYLPAYLEAAEYTNSIKQKDRAKLILEEATQRGYPIAWMDLAYWYKKNKQLDKYEECVEQAIQADVSFAFIERGFRFLGTDGHQIDREKLKNTPQENREQAAVAFLKAGQLHDPLGFECLYDLKLELSKIATTPDKEKAFKAEAFEAVKQGCALGWVKSFWKLDIFTSGEEYEKVLRTYGPAPDDCIESLESFLKENTKTSLPH